MNVERIRELADVIEKQPHTSYLADHGFNMETLAHKCGTPCCIAGWAEHLAGNDPDDDACLDQSAEWLGIKYLNEGIELFFPGDTYGSDRWDRITPAHAAAVLRNLADTGHVDWSIAAPEAK